MITNIYLVRHAHSTYTPDELVRPLSDKGFRDAQQVTKLLLHENISCVIASPYKRAIQTVEQIAKLHGLTIKIDYGFRERTLSNYSVDNFEKEILNAWKDLNYSLPGGESGYSAQERGITAINSILKEHKGENIAIGTHGNIMVLILNYYDKKYAYDFWCNLSMPAIYKLCFENNTLMSIEPLLK